jgi:signal transduction histidine kinase
MKVWLRKFGKLIARSLSAKLFILIAPLLLIVLVLSLLFLSTYITDFVNELYELELMKQSETLELSLGHGFMTSDIAHVREMIQLTGYESQLLSVRLLNKEGEILASSVSEEAGVFPPLESESCTPCHMTESGKASSVAHARSSDGSQDVVMIANRIENRIACQKCHAGSIATLGVLLMESPAAPVSFWLERLNWGLVAGGAGLFMLVVVIGTIVVHRLVIVPIRNLSSGVKTERMSEDAIGVLASKVSELESNLNENQEEILRRAENLDAILSISEAISQTLSIPQVLEQALDTVLEVMELSSGGMRLLDQEMGCFRLVSQRGLNPQIVQEIECIPQGIGFQGEVAMTLRPVFTSDLSTDPRTQSVGAVEEGFRSLVLVPLLAGRELVGIMEFSSKEAHTWEDDELRWFATIGRQIGTAINRIQLSEQIRDRAILEERGRLSQEIHDGLSQLVGSLRLRAEETLYRLEDEDWINVRKGIEEIERNARDAYASLREEMLGLRDTVVSGQDLVPLFTEFLSRFQRQWGIEAKLLVEDKQPYSAPPVVEVQLLRIVQEAITNIRRHASASQIFVRLYQDEDRLYISVKDDGRGFHTGEEIDESKLGLSIMRERASSVGGKVTVDSIPGTGTTVHIEMPRHLV